MMELNIFLTITSLTLAVTEGENILAIFPVPVKSHYVMSMRILEELASRNHEIDVYTSFAPKKQIKGIHYVELEGIKPYTTPLSVTEIRDISVMNMIKLMFEEEENGNDLCRKCFQNEQLQNLTKVKKQYDLLLVEMFVVDCFFAYASVFKIPVVALTSSVDLPWGSYRIGNLDNPSFIPTYFSNFNAKMTFFERILNTLTLIYAKFEHQNYLMEQQQIARNFLNDDSINLNDIVQNTSLFLVNSHFSINQARPKVPNFVEIAGVHIQKPKNLTSDYLDFIGTSQFAYFSFGSIANSESITLDKLQLICDSFQKYGIKVIWKADLKEVPKKLKIPPNFLIKKWLPQLDILCHPNITFFLTHSGLMSTQEAVYCAVPMLSVPIFADQFLNARNLELLEIGTQIEIESATLEQISKSMQDLIQNPKYKKNALKISKQFKDRPESSLDLAIYWIEYVIRYKGASHLRCKSADLSWIQYYLIDIVLIISSILISLFVVICLIIKRFFVEKKIKN